MKKRRVGFFNMQALTSCISMTLVLLLLGGAVFFILTAYNLSRQVRENIAVTLLMNDDIKDAQVKEIQQMLQKRPYVKELSYISEEEALQEMSHDMGTDPSEFLGHNPFSASIEVGLKADYANRDSMMWITRELKNVPQVVDLEYQQEWLDTINALIEKVSLVLLVLSGLLTFISFALINNTLRLNAYSKRFQLHTMSMVGASWGFIRRPFLWKSMSLGLIAALVADGTLAGGIYALLKQEPDLQEVVTPQLLLIVGGSVVAFGLLITLICAYISVNTFLNMKLKRLHFV